MEIRQSAWQSKIPRIRGIEYRRVSPTRTIFSNFALGAMYFGGETSKAKAFFNPGHLRRGGPQL
jgi:hypothetical protein